MALRNAAPLFFSPFGVSDAIDGTNVMPGAMAALTNLIPDPTTKNLWQCRPASVLLANFNSSGPFSSGFSSGFAHGFAAGTSGFISALLVVGFRAYGMVSNSTFTNTDIPFSYNLLTNTFDIITGTSAANTPTSVPATGAWTPPSMALVGTKIIVTHPGFNFAGGFAFGVLDISTPTAPTWTATNTSPTPLIALPQWVANFNGRAWFLVNPAGQQPAAYFTDVLIPTQITYPNQILTFDDNEPLTCAAGLGLFNQLGGVIQALIVFKSTANVYQITGDYSLGNLARNSLNVATGTASPLSVTTTPRGLAFLAPDGLRLIDFYARISDPIGVDGDGINAPFLNIVQPSRAMAACNQNVLRVSLQNGAAVGAPNQEYWYDLSRKKWSGPHTFPASLMQPFGATFIMTPVSTPATLFRSDVVQNPSVSTFVENGVPMTFNWTSCMLPDAKLMSEIAVVESTINMALDPTQGPVTVVALDQNGSVLGQASIVFPAVPSLWGSLIWGQGLWGGAHSLLSHRDLNWPQPLVFSRMQIQTTGACSNGFKIGDMFLRYQKLGYLQRYAGAP